MTEIGAVMARHSVGEHIGAAERDRLAGHLGEMPVDVAGSLAMNLANIAMQQGELDAAAASCAGALAASSHVREPAPTSLASISAPPSRCGVADDWEEALRAIARARRCSSRRGVG